MPKKYLHIFFSDNKFLDPTIELFEKVSPNRNKYLVIKTNSRLKFPSDYYNHLDKCQLINNNKNLVVDIINQYDIIIFHRLNFFLKSVLNKVNILNKKIVWMCWGGDIYRESIFFSNNEFILPDTLAFLKQKKYILRSGNYRRRLNLRLINFVLFIINLFFPKIIDKRPSLQVLNSLSKIGYITTVLPFEYDFLQQRTNLRAKRLFFSYSNLPMLLGELYRKNIPLGKNILVGNSGTYTNNHLDIFRELNKIKFGTKIIAPLSYGDNNSYSKDIADIGEEMFKEKFYAITNFMSRKEYTAKLLSCSQMILNNIRQEAVGTIIIGLYLGMKVYLNEKSLQYNYFKEEGFNIFSFPNEFEENHSSYLALAKIEHNRKKLEELWGEEVTLGYVEQLEKELSYKNM